MEHSPHPRRHFLGLASWLGGCILPSRSLLGAPGPTAAWSASPSPPWLPTFHARGRPCFFCGVLSATLGPTPPACMQARQCTRSEVLETSWCMRGACCVQSGCCGGVNEDVREEEGGASASWRSWQRGLYQEGTWQLGLIKELSRRERHPERRPRKGPFVVDLPPRATLAQQAHGGSLWAPWPGRSWRGFSREHCS